MDETKAIVCLKSLFPYKSEEYLRTVYRQCNCSMSATIHGINNEQPLASASDSNSGLGIVEQILDCMTKLCCCSDGATLSDEEIDGGQAGPSGRHIEEFFEVNIGEEFAKNLKEKFSDPSLILPTNSQPVIEIPVVLGRQLYVAYVESIFRQQEDNEKVLADLVKEDEEFARYLQEEENRSEITKTSAQATSTYHRLKEPKVPRAQKLEDLPRVHKVIDSEDSLDETDLVLQPFAKSAESYREDAKQHLEKRRHLYNKAKLCKRQGNNQQADYFHQLAKQQTKLYEQANNFAAAAFLSENRRRNPIKNTIDLHYLYVKEAIQALDIFLDGEIQSLQNGSIDVKSLMVITGRGKHSENGIPKIKPAVIQRLNERRLKFSVVNPGLLKVHVSKYSLICSDISF